MLLSLSQPPVKVPAPSPAEIVTTSRFEVPAESFEIRVLRVRYHVPIGSSLSDKFNSWPSLFAIGHAGACTKRALAICMFSLVYFAYDATAECADLCKPNSFRVITCGGGEFINELRSPRNYRLHFRREPLLILLPLFAASVYRIYFGEEHVCSQ